MTAARRAAVSVLWAFSERRMLLVLWLAGALASLGAVLPFVGPVKAHFDHSILGRADGFLSGEVLADLSRLLGKGSPASGPAYAALLSLVLSPALAGGTLGRLLRPGLFELRTFAADAAAHYLVNLRLLAWALLGLMPLGGLCALAFRALSAAEGEALYRAPFDKWRWLLGAAAALLLLAWRAAFDLARALAISQGERRTRRVAWAALKTVARRPSVLAGYAAVVGLGLGLAWLLVRVHAEVLVGTPAGALLALLVGQLLLWVRLGFSTAAYAYALEAAAEARPAPGDRG
jgi:hypothetical protein